MINAQLPRTGENLYHSAMRQSQDYFYRRDEVIYEALIEVKGFLAQSFPVTPKRLCCPSCFAL